MCGAYEMRFLIIKTSMSVCMSSNPCSDLSMRTPNNLELAHISNVLMKNSQSLIKKLAKVDEMFTNATKQKNICEFSAIMKEVLQLQKKFIESHSFTEFTKFKELKFISSKGNLFHQMLDNQEKILNSNDLKKFKEKVLKIFFQSLFRTAGVNIVTLKEMEQHNKLKVKKEAKEMSEEIINDNQKIINDCKEIINQLQVKIQETEVVNKRLTEKNLVLTKELKKQSEDFEEEKQMIIDSIKEEEKKQRDREEQEHKDKEMREIKKLKDSSVLFNKIYERNIGTKISDIPNFNLKISFKEEKHKAFLRDCVTSKIKLPNINGIRIESIPNSDASLAFFLSNCIPSRLCLLCINWFETSPIGIMSRFYIDSFSKAAANTIKEVYFQCINFTTEDLQTVIKAACNTERIVLRFCSIHCSSGLDFGSDLKYKTEFLSFHYCGSTDYKERTTDWKAEPSSFSYIVDAIGNSGLRSSLQKVSIYENKTLNPSKIQEEFNTKGMSHISVVEECPDPLSS